MAHIKLESWWNDEYPKYSIRDYNNKPIFKKLFAINDSYELQFENIYERYVMTDSENYLEWRTLDNRTSQKVGHNKDEDYFYLVTKNPTNEGSVTILSKFSTNCESGQIKATFRTHEDSITWELNNDLFTKNEYENNENACVINDFLSYTITKTGEKNIPKGKIKYTETTKTTPFAYSKSFYYQRGTKTCLKTEIITPTKEKYKSSSENLDISKEKIKIVKGSYEKINIIVNKPLEKYTKKLIKDKQYNYEENLIEKKSEKSGWIDNRIDKDEWILEWHAYGNVFYCKSSVIKASKKWIKQIKYNGDKLLEIIEFDLGNIKWGTIRENSDKGSCIIEWNGKKYEYSEMFQKQIDTKDSIEMSDLKKIDVETLLQETIEEAKLMFESINTLRINYFPHFTPKKEKVFKDNALKLQQINLKRKEEKQHLDALKEEIYNNISEGVKLSKCFLSQNKDPLSFSTILNTTERNTSVSYDLNKLFYELAYQNYLLKELQKAKNYHYQPLITFDFLETFNRLKINFRRKFLLKMKLLQIIEGNKFENRIILDKNGESWKSEDDSSISQDFSRNQLENGIILNKNDERLIIEEDLQNLQILGRYKFNKSIILNKKEENLLTDEYISAFSDDYSYHTICFNCNSVCHENCNINQGNPIPPGDKRLKSCSSIDYLTKTCRKCINHCSYKSHYCINSKFGIKNDQFTLGDHYENINKILSKTIEEIEKILVEANEIEAAPQFNFEIQRLLTMNSISLKTTSDQNIRGELLNEISYLAEFKSSLAVRNIKRK